ncbi:MAG: hypothetical protein HFJ58_03240 [Clostridia bacterium]|nr:hypothetical protein [Clostridia bacterium]
MDGQIKELTNLQDFKRVYKVFSGPPYNEKYTEEELEKIFKEYQEKGYVYGAYNNEECIRTNCVRTRYKRRSTS